jgi:hypothetical protein
MLFSLPAHCITMALADRVAMNRPCVGLVSVTYETEHAWKLYPVIILLWTATQ